LSFAAATSLRTKNGAKIKEAIALSGARITEPSTARNGILPAAALFGIFSIAEENRLEIKLIMPSELN
jgi:hypothetical protein